MRTLYVFLTIFFGSMLTFAVLNVVFYLRKLPSVSWMIIAFYVLTISETFFHFIASALLLINPNESPFVFDDESTKFIRDLPELLGLLSFRMLCWLIVIITLHLCMALRVIL